MRKVIGDIKAFFETGDVPTQDEYGDFIDSTIGGVNVSSGIVGLPNVYAATFSASPFTAATLNSAVIWVKFKATNTGAATLDVDGIGAAAIEKEGGVAVVSGDLQLDNVYGLIYNASGNKFRIVAGFSSGGNFLPLAGGTMDANAVIYGDTGNQAIYMDAQALGLGANDMLIAHEDSFNFEKAFIVLDQTNSRLIIGWDLANLDAWSAYSSNGSQLGIIQHETALGHGVSIADLGDTDTKIFAGGIQVVGTSTIADYTFSPSTGDTANVSIGTKETLFKQNVNNAVSLAGNSIIAKTDFVAYINKLGFNTGEAFETLIDYITATQDNTQTHQDKSGKIGLTSQTGNTSVLLTPPTITANQDDYNPTGFADATLLRIDLDANNRQITGMERPPLTYTDRVISISNLNASNDLKFMHNNAGSLPANRFLLRDGGDKVIKPNETAQFWYDFVLGRWKPLNRVG